MASENFNIIFLDGLIHKLKALNYNVSVEHVLHIHSLFLSLSFSEIKTGELKYLITPLLAKTKEGQEHIYRIIDDYVKEKTQDLEPWTAPWTNEHSGLKFYTLPRGKAESLPNSKIILVACAALFVLLVGIWAYWPTKTTRYDLPVISANTDSIQNTPQKPTNETTENPTTAVPVQNKAANANSGFSIQSLHAIEAKEKNVNVQLSIILGLIAGVVLSFVVFTTKEKEYLPDDESNNRVTINLPDKNIEPQDADAPGRVPGPAISIPALIKFANNNHFISEDRNIGSIKRNMKKYYTGNSQVFNIVGSIQKTAEKAGFFSPVYGYKKEQRKYLVLVDESNAASHLVKLFNFFTQSLTNAGVYIEKYAYGKNILTLNDSLGNAILLSSLSVAKPEYHLVVFGRGKQFVDDKTLLAGTQTAALLNAWASRSVITPLPIVDWGHIETQLRAQGFNVVPPETETVGLLIKSLTGKQVLSQAFLKKQLKSVYPVETFDFESPKGIYEYLNDEQLFQLVCALALYPMLDWNLTLALYNAIIKNNANGHTRESDYNTILKIARMPLLDAAVLSDSLRLWLLNNLDVRTEVMARKTIHAALEESKLSVPVNSAAYAELMAQLLINEFFLFAHDRKKFKRFASSKKMLLTFWQHSTDHVMKEYIKSGKARLLPENKPSQHLTIEEFMVMEREKEVRKITVLRVLVTCIPALFIYLFLITLKPAYAYPPNKEIYGQVPIIVEVKKDHCSDAIDSIKLYGNMIDNAMDVPIGHTTGKDVFLSHMDYGEPVTIEYNYNGVKKTALIPCRDSVYIVTISNCLSK